MPRNFVGGDFLKHYPFLFVNALVFESNDGNDAPNNPIIAPENYVDILEKSFTLVKRVTYNI